MKKLIFTLLIISSINIANAQFTGCFAPSNWTQHKVNTNGVILFQTNGNLSMLADTDGGGNGAGVGLDCNTNGQSNVSVCIHAPATGNYVFNWSWSGGNQATFTNEPFGYCINGIPTSLTSGGSGVGSATVPITIGDTFCLVVSTDNAASHFTVPTSIFVSGFTGPCVSTGLNEELSLTEIQLFPNPSAGDFHLNLPVNENAYRLKIIDVLGKEIQSFTSKGGLEILNLENQPEGLYQLLIEQEGKRKTLSLMKVIPE